MSLIRAKKDDKLCLGYKQTFCFTNPVFQVLSKPTMT
jgi:hypothetical protein